MIKITLYILTLLLNNLSELNAQQGCTDPAASNYDSTAKVNSGTCIYPNVKLTATLKFSLPKGLAENSGMIYWNDKILIHNDGGNDPSLFEMDTTGKVTRRIRISNATNMDWEDIAQDEKYVYIGDFGNNETGNRKNLRIFRVAKSDLLVSDAVKAEPIFFTYADQSNFDNAGTGNTDFDCEAMIVINKKIYLFTKQWVSAGTALYELPATPGQHVATKLGSLNVNGLISGADYDPVTKTIMLSGYGVPLLNRFVYLLYDYKDSSFFEGHRRKIPISGSKQTEGIAIKSRNYIYISNEDSFFGPQAVEGVDLSEIFRPLKLKPNTSSSKQ